MDYPDAGILLLMGSGELSASMVEVHKYALSLIPKPVHAVFLDTPAGFQLNADQIAQKAVEYARERLNVSLSVASYKNAASADFMATQQAVRSLNEANYIFSGPGSPSYAVQNWRNTFVFDALLQTLAGGGCLAFASAASLTLGRFTIPVYEIYKVGSVAHWMNGLNITGRYGLDMAIVPHWNNTSGGDHDTRHCFIGVPRWESLANQLPDPTRTLGIDEHTACILRFAENTCEVRGKGHVTILGPTAQGSKRETAVFSNGEAFSLDLLRLGPDELPAETEAVSLVKEHGDLLHHQQTDILQTGSAQEVIGFAISILEEMRTILKQQDCADLKKTEEALRAAMVSLASRYAPPPIQQTGLISPLIDLLIRVRTELRSARQWELADAIRDELAALGCVLEDQPDGTRWKLNF